MKDNLPSILKNYPLSPAQREAAVTRGVDIAVRAGAGTGKTRTLVGRYLSLLADGIPLRNIVAMTFTRKAAREMRNRVRQEITTYLEKNNVAESEQRFWETLEPALDAARISTIHGICGEILRAHPAEAKVDPRFDLLDETASAMLRRDTVESVLSWAIQSESEEITPLLKVLSEKQLIETLEGMLGKLDELEDAFKRFPETGVLAVWQERLKQEQAAALNAILQRPDVVEAIATLRSAHPIDPNDKQTVNRQAVLDFVLTDTDEKLNWVQRMATLDFRGGSAKAWSGGKTEKDEVMAALKALREPIKKDDTLKVVFSAADELWAELMPIYKRLFVALARTYRQKKGQLDALDFDDLEKRAVALLESYPAVRNYWQGEVKALLVDEFQDTNDRQLRLVRLLAPDSGKLFIVGDAKQSIYRFRGADVTVFRGEEEDIKLAGGSAITLNTSYRAHKVLLDGMNQLLRPVLGDDGSHRQPYEAPFEPLDAGQHNIFKGITHPFVEFHLALGNKPIAFPAAVRGLVGRLQSLISSSDLNWGDVAILCRSSGAFATYEDAFDEANIPYLTLSGRGFLDRPEIRDLLNALKAINDPHDDVTLVGLLRSPACGLSDTDIFHLLNGRESEQSVWDLVQTEIFWPDGVDQVKLNAAYQLISGLNQQVDRVSAADIFKSFLDQTHYRAKLQAAGMSRGLRNVSKLLSDMHQSELISLSAFLESVENLKDSGSREGEARSTADGAVQLMTIHASKGLEFPVVVLGDAGNSGGNRVRFTIYPQLWIMFPGKHVDNSYVNQKELESGAVKLAQAIDKRQEEAEKDRLLYVALTRAQQMLMINGNSSLNRAGKLSGGSWLKQLAEIAGIEAEIPADYDAEGDKVHPLWSEFEGLEIGGACYEPNITLQPLRKEPLPTALSPNPPPLAKSYTQDSAKKAEVDEKETPQRVWQVVPTAKRPTAPAWVVGSIVHEALAQWRFPNSEDQTSFSSSFESWAQTRGREFGLTSQDQLKNGVDRAKFLLNRFKSSPVYQEISAAEQRLAEVPYVLEEDEGVIDLLAQTNGNWTIYDFKTDRVRSQNDQNRVIEAYTKQLERYKAAVSELVGGAPKVKLVLLNGESEVVIVELA